MGGAMFRFRLAFAGVVSSVLLAAFLYARAETPARGAASPSDVGQRTPVLVELFTSEGCSDCPPADALLQRLDKSQPVAGADLVVLSEHVDYWDDIGWKDPYSSHDYTERQGAYAGLFRLRSPYTPQMVIDGRLELVGSDERVAIDAIRNAAKTEKVPMSLSAVHFEGNNIIALHVEAAALPADLSGRPANVMLAVADDSDESQVSHGENAGRTLTHVAVVRSLVVVGTVDKSSSFSKDARIRFTGGNPRNIRLVAFAQDRTGRIWAVGQARLSN